MAALRLAVVAVVALAPATAAAHDLRPGAVALREVAPHVFALRLVTPMDGADDRSLERPELPDGCAYEVARVRCDGELAGPLRLPSLAGRRVKVVVHVTWRDGRRFETLLREGETTAVIEPGARSTLDYLWLGVEHILGGLDHLLFVLALALVARAPRRVAIAVTGFTVAHSLTLAATALGVLAPPRAATELVIAASVLLLAAEAARDRETLTARRPWVVALAFGLVHGFGFAGALAELGLPADGIVPALLGFNAGVELGQLVVLGVAFAVARPLARALGEARRATARRVAPYALGLPAGVWTVERAAAWLDALG